MRSTLTAVVLLLAPIVGAQTFVVDAANGAGAHFTDIGTAVAAVPDGAVLLVRDGHYASFAIMAKSIKVVGGPGVNIGATLSASITISGLAASQVVVISGVRMPMGHLLALGVVRCDQCQGRVHLDAMAQGGNTRLEVDNCAQVMATNCSFVGGANPFGASVLNSQLVLVDCALRGGSPGHPGLLQTGGHTALVSTAVDGGMGPVGGDGVVMQGGQLRVDGGCAVRGGPLLVAGLAVAGTGAAQIDPSALLTGAAPLIAPSITLTSTVLPAVRSNGGAIGGVTSATLTGPPAQFGVLWVGLPDAPLALPGWGVPLWVLNGHILALGMLSTPITATVPVPNVPALFGGHYGWQGLTIDAAGALETANPVWFVLH